MPLPKTVIYAIILTILFNIILILVGVYFIILGSWIIAIIIWVITVIMDIFIILTLQKVKVFHDFVRGQHPALPDPTCVIFLAIIIGLILGLSVINILIL